MASGTMTVTNVTPLRGPARPVQKLTLAWTSTSGGAVDQTTAAPVCGEILRVVFVPGTSGTQPTNLYDVTLLDESGIDVLEGQGSNLSNAAASEVCPGLNLITSMATDARPVVVNDLLELVVANAGNAKTGSVILYVR